MAATAQSPDNRPASSNSTTGATVTVCIVLLIIVLGYLTHRFRSRVTSSMIARSPYQDGIQADRRVTTRYHNLERIPILQYNAGIRIECHKIKGRKGRRKEHEETGLQSDKVRSRANTKTLSTAKEVQATKTRTASSHDPIKIPEPQSSESNPGLGIDDHSPQFLPSPTLPIHPSNSTQHTNKTAEEEESAACSICVSTFRVGENIRILPCGNYHIYHRQCIDPWLLGFAWTCPLW